MSKLLENVLIANIYLQPVQFSLSIITNILNIRILCSRSLRKSPCTHYFLAYAILSIIYTCLACLTQFLRGFYIDWANGKIGCKIHFYVLFLIPFQVNLMLILASYNRYCSSSKSRRIHSRDTIRTARIHIIFGTFISAIYMSPMLIIYNWIEIYHKCIPQINIITNIYTFSQVFLYYLLAPLLMIIFGFLTISNIGRQSARAKLLTVSIRRRRRTERQLSRMLLFQIIVHVILILPFGIIYYINILKPSTRTPNILAIRYISVMWQQCDYFVSFFLYVFSGRVYRQELSNLIRSNGFKSRRRQLRNDIQQFTLIPTSMLPAIIPKDVFI
ncbi:unnamed protein product [Adineta steineri]|uniref:G-protein coupled receptors family 1 profile domain-containing protein n=1 Tax=Adineta steineri TaxID=433720 RepID=A0A813NRF5_9BILA|nr:unnamed protein product [Adineta steineri]CAF3771768.1 unnamed protein product [Adineta steineri]